MRNFADTFWVWLLGYVTYTDVKGAVLPQIEKTDDFSSLNKILIVGGYECPPHSQPWQAGLFLKNKFRCGGVLVHPEWVLTAAHCQNKFDTIGLGLHNRKHNQEPGSQMIKPHILVPHPCYRPSILRLNDIMLVKLRKPARITETVIPITPSSRCPETGASCILSGWGRPWNSTHPNFLQCLQTVVLAPETCGETYPAGSSSKMFCTYSEKEMGASPSDSGGPVVCEGDLQGIINGGSLGKDVNVDIHVNVVGYKDWIEKTIQNYTIPSDY